MRKQIINVTGRKKFGSREYKPRGLRKVNNLNLIGGCGKKKSQTKKKVVERKNFGSERK